MLSAPGSRSVLVQPDHHLRVRGRAGTVPRAASGSRGRTARYGGMGVARHVHLAGTVRSPLVNRMTPTLAAPTSRGRPRLVRRRFRALGPRPAVSRPAHRDPHRPGQATVAESLQGALQRVLGVAVGVGVAALASHTIGISPLTVALLVLASQAVGWLLGLTIVGTS